MGSYYPKGFSVYSLCLLKLLTHYSQIWQTGCSFYEYLPRLSSFLNFFYIHRMLSLLLKKLLSLFTLSTDRFLIFCIDLSLLSILSSDNLPIFVYTLEKNQILSGLSMVDDYLSLILLDMLNLFCIYLLILSGQIFQISSSRLQSRKGRPVLVGEDCRVLKEFTQYFLKEVTLFFYRGGIRFLYISLFITQLGLQIYQIPFYKPLYIIIKFIIMPRAKNIKPKIVHEEQQQPEEEPRPETQKEQFKLKKQVTEENKAEQQEQQQLDVKQPKKYTKKSVEALQRIERSKHQKIFLLDAQRGQEQWKFHVLGTTGSQYHVTVSTTVKCTCTDFKFKKKPCKHIFFIVTQVSQNEEILNYFRNSTSKISEAAYKVLDKQLLKRLRERLNSKEKKDPNSIDLKDETDCTICFCEMDKENEDLQNCKTCTKYFHVVCLDAWKNHNPTCPLCRTQFVNKGPTNDPLGKLKQIKI